jgi:hypothetical protein
MWEDVKNTHVNSTLRIVTVVEIFSSLYSPEPCTTV